MKKRGNKHSALLFLMIELGFFKVYIKDNRRDNVGAKYKLKDSDPNVFSKGDVTVSGSRNDCRNV